jgi:hypothetical protein
LKYESYSLLKAADDSARLRTGPTSDQDYGHTWTMGVDFNQALAMARDGWPEELDETLQLCESAVTMADKERMVDVFEPVWDVSGATVDVARYLQGEPECMIDFPLAQTSKSGKVITLVASVNTSASITADTIVKRGRLIVALAMALERLGHGVELWAGIYGVHAKGRKIHCEVKIRIKGVDDAIDPAVIMFAYAHPAMQRRIMFGLRESGCKTTGHGPLPLPREGFPDGTIFLPELKSNHDVPDADVFLRKYLGELGLLAE